MFLAVVVGITLGMKYAKHPPIAKQILVVSAGFLFTVCIMEMFPIIYLKGEDSIGIWVILGVFIQIVLEYFSKGIEHGHTHIENPSKVPLSLVIGLLIHSFIEGLPLLESHEDIAIPNLWMAVLLHKIPIAIMFALAIEKMDFDVRIKYALYMLFAFATPLGMYVGEVVNERVMLYLYAINAGIFLHISSLIIFESNKNHSFNLKKLGLLLLGVALGFLI